MKSLKTLAVCVLLSVSCYTASAQNLPLNEPDYNKPKLFNDLPAKFPVDMQAMDLLLEQSNGRSVSVVLNNTTIHGVVMSKSSETDTQLKSIVIKLTGRMDATFAISKVYNANGSTTFNGRIISRNHGDAYEITQENGVYILIKKTLHELISE
jgi:hypothetical protein